MKPFLFLSSLALLCSPFFFSVPATAMAAYSVSPLVVNVEAKQRDVIRKKIILTNEGPAPITVYPSVNNISLTDGGTVEKFLSPAVSDRSTSLASWIEINRSGKHLMPGEAHEYELTLRINPTAKAGTYNAIIGFGSGRNDQIAKAQVAANNAPRVIVTVTIVEEKNELLKLSRFIVDKFITSGENQAAVYTIKNPGDESLVPEGEIIFYNSRGEEVGSVPVNTEGATIDPGSEKQFNATVPSEGLFGKYKAFLSVEYGNAQLASVQDTAYFYVFPFMKVLLIFGAVVLVVVVGSFFLHKRYFGDVEEEESEQLSFHIRDSLSGECEHDINLKKQNES